MKLYYPIVVDLYHLYPLKKMNAQQENIGRGALITLTAAGQVIEPENETVNLWAKKPDGTVSFFPCTIVDGKIKADFTEQMLAAPGIVEVELEMLNETENITTTIFSIEVHRSNINTRAVESSNEFLSLLKALQEVEELKKTGLKGDPGDAATISVGTVASSAPGGVPVVINSGTASAAVFDFVIPRGETGPRGPIGPEEIFFGAFAEFPTPGDPKVLYVDTSVKPRLMYNWDNTESQYVPAGGAGGADGSGIDIPLTLPSTGWIGTSAPYSQVITVPQIREGMTPLMIFSGEGDDARYAYDLLLGHVAGYTQVTFSASDLPEVDIDVTLKGVPAQQLDFADNTVVVVVSSDGWTLNESYSPNRYEKTIPVDGMVAGADGGSWDIVRSADVLTEAESKIAASITDVIPMDGAIKIVCLWEPGQQYLLKLTGTYTQATEGSVLLAGMQDWFDKADATAGNISEEFSTSKAYAVGDYCIHKNALYKFVAAKTAGEWDVTKVEPTTVGGEFGALNLNSVNKSIQNISGAPTKTEQNVYFFSASDAFPLADISIPKYTKGVFIANGKDGVMIGVDLIGHKLIIGTRVNNEWTSGRVL